MTLAPLLDLLGADAAVGRALAVARNGEPAADIAVTAGARPALIAAMAVSRMTRAAPTAYEPGSHGLSPESADQASSGQAAGGAA